MPFFGFGYSASSTITQSNISGGGGTDSDAQAFIDAAGITDSTQQSAINTLVTDLKTANIWTKMKAVYPFVGGSSTSHKYNLVNPVDSDAAFRLSFSTGWVHSSNGVQANGSSTYASTYLIPNTHLTLRNTHLSSYVRTDTVAGNKMDLGCGIAPSSIPLMTLSSKYGTTTVTSDAYTYAGNRIAVSNTDARGYYIGTRTSINSHKVYKNGLTFGTDTNNESQGSMPNIELFFGAYNQSGSVLQVSDRQYAFASIGDGLTDTEASNFYTAVQNYQTTLGRNV
jgi:hypothetical protein